MSSSQGSEEKISLIQRSLRMERGNETGVGKNHSVSCVGTWKLVRLETETQLEGYSNFCD